MNIVPKSAEGWLALLLFPFKVFVPAGYLAVVLEREMLGYRMDNGYIVPFVLAGYFVSFLVLVVGAMVQLKFGSRKAYLSTCCFCGAVFVFGVMLLPYLSHT